MTLNPQVIIPSENPKGDWIEKNIETMMGMVMKDARLGKSLPTAITMNPVALKKFVEILKSKNAYFPYDGKLDFLGIPVYSSHNLPFGTFTLERFKDGLIVQ